SVARGGPAGPATFAPRPMNIVIRDRLCSSPPYGYYRWQPKGTWARGREFRKSRTRDDLSCLNRFWRLKMANAHKLYKEEKLAIFIDGANLYNAAKTLGFDIDYRKLLEFFADRARLIRAFYYTAIVEDQDYSPLRPLVDWLDYNG